MDSPFLYKRYVTGQHFIGRKDERAILGNLLSQSEIGVTIGNGINGLARKCLTLSLFFIGASLTRQTLKSVGLKPMLQGLILWILISLATLAYILL